MIENIMPVEEIRSLARVKKKSNEFKSIHRSDLEASLQDGWSIFRENKNTIRLVREKRKDVLLEDRVWSLLYNMGFTHLSGKGGANLAINPKEPKTPYNQIDVVSLDSEVALAVECKCADAPRKSPQFQKDLAKHSIIRQRFAKAIHGQFALPTHKRIPVLAMFTWNLILTDNDIARAKQEKVVLFNENDLEYYEQLVSHLGPAAKYQFFADMLPGKQVAGLKIQIPALKAKMGQYPCYTFSIRPDYLLKIAYVSHRAKGKATDVDTYQRMIKKNRLKKIKAYIEENGIFPTNIVINFEGNKNARFEPKEPGTAVEGAKYGTLHLTPSYRAAWIVDGQHRLFAYSGSKRASTSHLSVLAFQGLPPAEQAQLFIDINHEQKSVKTSLLQELYAELHWDAEDEATRVGAIISKTIQALDDDKDSPFYNRILLSDDTRTARRCITLSTIFKALNQPGMFIIKPNLEYGPLWTGDNLTTLKRAVEITKEWFKMIQSGAGEWWDLGADEGGGLAMNDGVVACIGVLKSVFQHLKGKGYPLIQLSNEEVVKEISPFGDVLGDYLGGLDLDGRKAFRGARGIQGQTTNRRQCEKALNDAFPEFEPPGLLEEIELLAGQTNEEAYPIIQHIERMLRSVIIDVLKAEYGEDDDQWWYNGVSLTIRKKVIERHEEEGGIGVREDYFDLIHYRQIALDNWQAFSELLAYGQKGNKQKRTEWMVKVNDLRKIVMHAKGRVIDWSQLQQLREYEAWLEGKAEGREE